MTYVTVVSFHDTESISRNHSFDLLESVLVSDYRLHLACVLLVKYETLMEVDRHLLFRPPDRGGKPQASSGLKSSELGISAH